MHPKSSTVQQTSGQGRGRGSERGGRREQIPKEVSQRRVHIPQQVLGPTAGYGQAISYQRTHHYQYVKAIRPTRGWMGDW